MSDVSTKNPAQHRSVPAGPSRQQGDIKRTSATKAPPDVSLDRLDHVPIEIVNEIIAATIAERPTLRALATLDALSKANPRAAAAIAQHPAHSKARAALDRETAELTKHINHFLRSGDYISTELKQMLATAEQVVIVAPSNQLTDGRRVKTLLRHLGSPEELVIRNVNSSKDLFACVTPEKLASLFRLEVSHTCLSTTDFVRLTELLEQAAALQAQSGGPFLQRLNLASCCKELWPFALRDEDPCRFLSRLTHLRALDVGGLEMNVKALAKQVKQMPQLVSLSVPNTSWSTKDLSQFLGTCGEQIKELDLRRNDFNWGGAPNKSERGGSARVGFAQAPNLEALILDASSVDAKWLNDANITACEKLRFLSVAGNEITSEQIDRIGITRLPNLERLSYGAESESIVESLHDFT